MDPFLLAMLAGIIGLIMMALPGMQRHGHAGVTPHIAPPTHGQLHLGHGSGVHAPGHALPGVHAGHAMPHAATPAAGAVRGSAGVQNAEAPGGFDFARLIPSPRAIFSILTLFGAFGYAIVQFVHLWPIAAVLAFVPAWAVEYFAVRPLWNVMFQFQGKPTTPIEALVACEAKALTPFRNGRGLVSVEHDGRVVQFSARLQDEHANVPIKVGDTLCVEDVDSENQRMLVSVK